ncbi:MAG: hypothetical protein JXR73_21110 [Candidatus Omnitrophica bacterium]|nr:hypothetical protein [Candidatus Omnitrophota bacterium]
MVNKNAAGLKGIRIMHGARSVCLPFIVSFLFTLPGFAENHDVVLLDENFSGLRPGMFSPGAIGAHAEYHYLAETSPKENWVVSCFSSNPESQRAWRVIQEEGDAMMQQVYRERTKHTHPMIVTGEALWGDYTVEVRFSPDSDEKQSGFAVRYKNDRCYYFIGVCNGKAVLKRVNHATAYHKPDEKILAETQWNFSPRSFITAKVTLQGKHIRAELNQEVVLEADDDAFLRGKVALTADIPTRYSRVIVTAAGEEKKRIDRQIQQKYLEEKRLQSHNPKPVVWKKMAMKDFGVGRNVRFGDLNGDGEIDVLFGQVLHHGPKDRNSELSCLTAATMDGEVLWQIGQPDMWKDHLTNDVGFQIHDLNHDGRHEVVYCMNQEIIVARGSDGKTLYRSPTPETPPGDHGEHNIFPRILGDSLYFCDLRGIGHDGDIIFKDRYKYLWALNDRLEIMWTGKCVTGHYPYAFDIDGDKKDELMMGYTLFDDDGQTLWSLDGVIQDHADGVAIVEFKPGEELRLLCAASDEGMFFTDMKGNILKHHYLGHVQNPATANFRDDLPGLESVSINFWGNQGIIHFFDADGQLYYDFEPVQHGSMCLPVNWTGASEEFFVLSPNVTEGGLYDGWGRRVVNFPADGHPDLCNAVLDITGDCRDEIVVWDAFELWVYTQDDNPREGRLYQPIRNPLYNYSNYQATVSLPDWNE